MTERITKLVNLFKKSCVRLVTRAGGIIELSFLAVSCLRDGEQRALSSKTRSNFIQCEEIELI